MEQPDYSKIFASGSAVGELLNMPDESYLRGWGYLNASEPPPMEFFNYIMNGYDRKLFYLFMAGRIRKNNTRYEVGEIATTPNLSSRFELRCKTAGTTDVTEPIWAKTETDSFTDGRCIWEIRDKYNAELLDGKDSGYFEALIDGNAKIKKIAFNARSAAWSVDGTGKKLTIQREGFSCIAVYRIASGLEEQVMAGITMDERNIYVSSPNAFDGYLIVIKYTNDYAVVLPKTEYTVTINQPSDRTITVKAGGQAHTETFVAKAGTVYTAEMISAGGGDTIDVTSANGVINDDLTIGASN